MKTFQLTLLLCLASCSVQHIIGENTHSQALTCGGFAGTTCGTGYTCVDDTADSCDPKNGGADCPGVCVSLGSSCGGFAGIHCADGQECIDDPRDSCDPNNGGADCPGVCVAYEPQDAGNAPADAGVKHCGGFAGMPCPNGQDCVDDPSDSCDPAHGGADCPGICVAHDGGTDACASGGDPCAACPGGYTQSDTCSNGSWTCQCLTSTACGGLAQIACPGGAECVDNPNDGCDPHNGGADCPGLCVAGTGTDAGYMSCGGFAGIQCPNGLACSDNPFDGCDPHDGGADCPGICLGRCGSGTGDITCPGTLTCVPDNATACTTDGGPDACSGTCW